MKFTIVNERKPIVIEKGVPIPREYLIGCQLRYPLMEMKVKDSFSIPYLGTNTRGTMSSCISNARKKQQVNDHDNGRLEQWSNQTEAKFYVCGELNNGKAQRTAR